jgi:hypothetical protein
MEETIHTISGEISIKELVQKLHSLWRFLLSKWMMISLFGFIGAVIGLGYAFLKPIKYTSKLSFVIEDGKSGGGGLASLAGQFGFDLGGVGGGGIFSGDNILLFLKSEGLVRETLLTFYDEDGKITLADRYAEADKLKEGWQKKPKIGFVDFSPFVNKVMPRKEDSLIQTLVASIIETDLSVAKPDKKASFIEVKVITKDELLSKLFTERLVKIATDRYLETKTKTKVLNIAKLQYKADSLAFLLNNKTYAAAASQQSLVDANPALRTAPIASEISSREKTMAATIFAEVVKNLEMSKTILNQETPVIQIVDQSTLPLPKEKVSKLKSLIMGGLLGFFFVILFLLGNRWFRSQLKS